jgi:hypothetical protein
MAYSKARRLSDSISATGEIAAFVDGSITHADLHTDMNLTSKTVLVANASTGDSDTTVANTAFVQQEIAALVASAPGTLNTLNELAAALGDDASFSTTVTDSIALKAPLASPTFTGDATFDTNTLFVDSSSNVVGIRTTSPYTVGGTAGLTIAGSSVLLSMGNSNTDLAYIRRMGSGIFQWQTFSVNANDGELQLQPYGGKVGIGTTSPSTILDVVGDITATSTDTGSSAGPIINLVRDSSSPADADYIGQIKFKGEDDGGASTTYSKITGKIGDASNGSEDGIIEFAAQKAGSSTILARLSSTKLALLNSTELEAPVVDGENFKINGAQGSDGQLMTSTGSGVAWEDAPASGPSKGLAIVLSMIF